MVKKYWGDNMKEIIFHIDVNAAFLSWSAVYRLKNGYPNDIRNECAVIGGDEKKRKGVVLAKSNLAKQKGILTGESLYSARGKCSNLKVYPPQYKVYEQMSKALFTLLGRYTPDLEIFSIDECFLDYGKVKKLYGDPIKFAYQLKEEIKAKLGFSVNIGIAHNKLCAKMASDFSKPDQVHTLFPEEIKEKLWVLPVGSLFGVGVKTTTKLEALNIHTIGALAQTDINILYPLFKSRALELHKSANGIDSSLLKIEKDDPKGFSKSQTLAQDITTAVDAYKVLLALAEDLGITLRKEGKYARVIMVNLKDRLFKSYTHQKKLANATNITKEIYEVAKLLFQKMWTKEPLRLIGISLSDLVNDINHQLSLFEDLTIRDHLHQLDRTVDALKAKYGPDIIKKGTLIKKPPKDIKKD